MTPLHMAVCNGHQEVAAKLLEQHSPDVQLSARDSRGNTAVHLAANNLDGRMLDLLLDSGGDAWAANNDGWTPLLAALGKLCAHRGTMLCRNLQG